MNKGGIMSNSRFAAMCTLLLAIGSDCFATEALQQSQIAGEKAFRYKCIGCHEHTATHRTVGPNLTGVYNRKAGASRQGIYSRALLESDIIWDQKNLDEFLSGPSEKIPLTFMPFHGIADVQERTDIIEYLKALTESAEK